MIKPPVGLNRTKSSGTSLIQPPDLAPADRGLPTAPDRSATGPDVINSGSSEDAPIDRAEQAALIRGLAHPAKAIGSDAADGNTRSGAGSASTAGQSGDAMPIAGGGGSGDLGASTPIADGAPTPIAASAGGMVRRSPSSTSVAATERRSPAGATAQSGLVIHLIYDKQALAAPQSFRTGMQDAANILDAAIQNNITINIKVGYGEFNGQPLTNQNESLGGPAQVVTETYSQLRALLKSHETSSADVTSVNALPNTTTLNGVSNLVIASAEAKALGVLSPNNTALDGSVGMGTNFTGDVLIGGALHEITHAMGRIVGNSALSLFRYTSVGKHDFSFNIPAAASYFSIDGGVTKLADFGVSSDPSDFLNSSPLTPQDPFDETISGSTLTSVDLTMMDVLGFQLSPLSPPPPPPPSPPPPPPPPPLNPLQPSPLPPLLQPSPLPPLLQPSPLPPLLQPSPLPPLLQPSPLPPLLQPSPLPRLLQSSLTAAPLLTRQGNPVTTHLSFTFGDIGHVNGDGKSDILARNTGGAPVTWTMGGSALSAAQFLTYQGTAINLDRTQHPQM